MQSSLRDELVSCLTRFKPGTVLADKEGHFWIRRARMVITRHRFNSLVGDDQEQYYQQNYLLQAPLTDQNEVVLDPPESWIELCDKKGMCDAHLDAISCLQSAISRVLAPSSPTDEDEVVLDPPVMDRTVFQVGKV